MQQAFEVSEPQLRKLESLREQAGSSLGTGIVMRKNISVAGDWGEGSQDGKKALVWSRGHKAQWATKMNS